MDAIQIQNLDVVFGDKSAQALALLDEGKTRQEIIDQTEQVVGVDNVTMSVKEGEICVLMGLSGSGKSSLLRAVNGLNGISRGSLKIKDGDNQVELSSCNEETLRHLRTHRVSMVFQKFALMPWLTVLDNVAFGLEMQGIPKTQRRAKAREQLEMVELAEWENKYPHELSGGMQQRVGLARAFAMDTDILLMDEPFSALDPLIRAQLQDELIQLQNKLNKTILFVSHDLDEALKIGNNIAIMESGKLIQHGKPEEIVLSPENDYVKDFVSHTNPLNVLKGRSLMQPAHELTREGAKWRVGDTQPIWFEIKDDTLKLDSSDELSLVDWRSGTTLLSEINHRSVVIASPDIGMRDAIEIKQFSSQPILLVENDELIGVLNDSDFYAGLLGKHHRAAA
ncbi:ABC transporter: ATP binding protein [Vibrio nigripulchritudo ATCC 27043]|uniref:choline ABC transporter ATP-binding protein n=1 Tax=Vibrio nigripulchritudo TaxID=28173 RepID=UPI00021C3862|nr:choline ABC transporter ATP-binding protein [Vibrio nigripulchritudo]EGU56010.1 ABC transporter: ATP binding protein [Vibrio nigripulchritudo ATCC 27043]